MATRMLIDATHAEETRVVVVRGTRLEEFDFETSTKRQIKGNIYLAKVTRVEPSLQAAFVEYGGNRHGFLAFSEIHPDYYQIPVADREALVEQYAAEERAAAEAEGENDGTQSGAEAEPGGDGNGATADSVESLGGDEFEEVPIRRQPVNRVYRIQEVIKRRQILLVQVAKEERGNKGAALTTYLSLAGRYCVLMPNTARGGGISRKIVNINDRKRLKKVVGALDVPEGMGVIVRTAGMERSKAEIKRDFEYLLRLWDNIRELTLASTAPALIYEEADLIKRSIRDLHNKDIEEILVEGDEGYRAAKDFMRMLMPSHAKRIKRYKENIPLFHRYQVEQQFDSMYSPEVKLKSGGYIVINPTEALVSIDVNSGKATRERNIEETAYKTNLEAAEEVARQLRLRDLAGLIVIDFIDMDDPHNNRNVERRLKECLKADRARIQVGRISPFGLLEMSRQRLRPSLIEASTHLCPHCGGHGVVRSIESSTLHVLRAIEEEGIRERSTEITVHVATGAALYLLNQKRQALNAIEQRYGLRVTVAADDSLIPPQYRIERAKTRPAAGEPSRAVQPEYGASDAVAQDDETAGEGGNGDNGTRKRRRRRRRRKASAEQPEATVGEAAGAAEAADEADLAEPADEDAEAAEAAEAASEGDGEDDRARKRRRRGRRGGRRRAKEPTVGDAATEDGAVAPEPAPEAATDEAEAETGAAPDAEDAPEETEARPEPAPRRRRPRRRTSARTRTTEVEVGASGDGGEATGDELPPPPAPEPAVAPSTVEPAVLPLAAAEVTPEAASAATTPAMAPSDDVPPPAPAAIAPPLAENAATDEAEAGEAKPARRGWWRRRR